MLLLALLLLPAEACETPTRTSDVLDAAGRAEVAWTTMDADGLDASVAETRTDLACLGEPVSVDGAAAAHRTEALAAFLKGDTVAATGQFAAARAAMPGWKLSSTIAPEGHPLRDVYEAAEPGSTRAPLSLPSGAAWCSVDGVRSDDVPADRPFILQCFGADGAVQSTAMATQADLPPPAPLPTEPMPEPPKSTKRKTVGLAISAGVLALGAGAAFGVAAFAHDAYWDVTTPPEKLPGLQTATDASIIAGGALGAAALGCGTGAVLTGRF